VVNLITANNRIVRVLFVLNLISLLVYFIHFEKFLMIVLIILNLILLGTNILIEKYFYIFQGLLISNKLAKNLKEKLDNSK